jgi:NitT/TauT family transport system permease protein
MSLEVVVPLRRELDARLRQPRRPGLRADLGRVALVVLGLAGWELAAATVADPHVVPAPSRILAELLTWSTAGTLWSGTAATAGGAAPVLLIGTAGGVALGVLLGRSGYAADLVAPLVTRATAGPRVVASALFAVWLVTGAGTTAATVLVLLLTVACAAFRGAREVDRALVDNARVLGAGRRQLMATVVLPGARVRILATAHVAVGLALVGTVAGEYAAANHGLGLLIRTAQQRHDVAGVYAGLLVVAVTGLVAGRLVSLLEDTVARRPR